MDIKLTRNPGLHFLLVILIWASFIHKSESLCGSRATSCGRCINEIDDGEDCGWCADQNFVGPRCASLTYLNENRCYNQEKITSDLRVLRNEPLSERNSKRIAPQQVSLNIKKRTGKETEFQFEATAAKRWLAIKVSFPRRKYIVTMTSTCRFRWRDSGRGRCIRTRRGETLTFTLKIRVLDCNHGNGRITVSIPGYTQDKLNLDITSSCPCSCEENKEMYSAVCHGNGHLSCGTCECSEGYFGKQCECMGLERDTCRPSYIPGIREDRSVCSGRGNCVCGMCDCQAGFRGQHCECSDVSCDYFEGALCGGVDRGTCDCGECTCKSGYTGRACEITMSTDDCIAPNGIICNGQGDCVGNRCRCTGEYRGRTCDECPSCRGQCSILQPCIQCTVFQTGELTPEQCYYQCRQYGISIVESLEQRESGRLCMFRDDDDCEASFMYRFDVDGELVVEASRSKPTCSDDSCDYFDGALCGGFDRGTCHCGECTCKSGYTGTTCEISMSTDDCLAPNGIICNGQGDCVGNRCRCTGEYRGRTCDECPSCPGQCSKLWPCIQCKVFQTGELTPEQCYYQCRQYAINIVNSLEQTESGRRCMFRDVDGCLATFMYNNEQRIVTAASRKDCPRQ